MGSSVNAKETISDDAVSSAATLDRILLLQTAIHTAVDEDQLSETLCREIQKIPGLGGSAVCIEGRLVASSIDGLKLDSPCKQFLDYSELQPQLPACPLLNEGRIRLPLMTPRHAYGGLILQVTDKQQYLPYERHLQNTAKLLSLHLENRRQAAALSRLNESVASQGQTQSPELPDANQSLRFAQYAMDHIGEEAFWIRPDGRLAYANEAACRALGYSREELLQLTVTDIDPTFPAVRWSRHWHEMQQRGFLAIESIHRTKDEREFPVDVAISHVVFGGEEYVCVFARDISERKQAAEILLREKQFIEGIFQGLPGVACAFDADGRLFRWNRNFEIVLEYSAEELIGMNVIAAVSEKDRNRVGDVIKTVLGGGQVAFEFDALTKSGREIPYYGTGVLIGRDNESYVIGVGVDISEQKAVEEALRGSEQRYALAQRAANVGSWDWNILTDDLRWSEQIEPMFGFARGKFNGTYEAFLETVYPEDRWFVTESVHDAVEHGKEYDIEHRILWPDGTLRWLAETGDVIRNNEGRAVRMLGIVRDITEKKLAQAERERLVAELEARNAELERFVYTVSHDLKTPLITISWRAGMLGSDLTEGNVEEALGGVARITEASQTMVRLLDDVLELSRIGRVVGKVEEVSVAELTAQVIASLEGQLRQRGVRVVISPDLPVLKADRTRLREVLQNLIENAVKFLGNQTEPRIEIGVRHDGKETVCFVRDNGIGVAPRFHETIFGLFDQLDPHIPGTGIGLTTAKRIIEVHNGQLWCESDGDGHGSTFCFTLPETVFSGV